MINLNMIKLYHGQVNSARLLLKRMFKKLDYKRLNYSELDRIDSHDVKRDEMHSFYLTFDFIDLIEKWPEIVGPKLASVTSPLKIRQDSLVIMTKHPSYSEHLSFLAEDIKKQIFVPFPNLKPIIKKLSFQTQESFFQQKATHEQIVAQKPKLHPQSPQYKILKQEAMKAFENVESSEVRDMLISIYIQSKFQN